MACGGRGRAAVATGETGARNARRMAEILAEGLGASAQEIFVGSTGVIGAQLPMDRIEAGIRAACSQLNTVTDPLEGNMSAARAIMTTDTIPKSVTREVTLSGKKVRLGAIGKGSGMIHPDMATMFVFITTDLAVEAHVLDCALREAVDPTLNMLSVDGETSTSDTTVILASGLAGNPLLTRANTGPRGARRSDYTKFREALTDLLLEMTRLLARDGEGATKLLILEVCGAKNEKAARDMARALSVSPLVKTAVFGADPNPGRILQTLGSAGHPVKAELIDITIGGVPIVKKGLLDSSRLRDASQAMKAEEVRIVIDIGLGQTAAIAYTCDYTYDYIRINAEYTT